MNTPRKLSYVALTLAYIQIVFGAIVRITGSGLGCGEHWPKCQGRWFPPLDRPDLIIEITHRYVAAALVLTIIALIVAAYRSRQETGVGGKDGVLRSAILAAIFVVAVALLGAATVKLALPPYIIVVHLTGAMAVLAALANTAIRAGGFGANEDLSATAPKTYRAAGAAVALAFLVLVLGALTANLPGAAIACQGFPWCRLGMLPTGNAHIQITHRVLAFLLLFHVMGITIGVMKRGAPRPIARATWSAFALIVLQIFIAAGLVESGLPRWMQSMHQAVGTLVWISIFILAMLTRKGALAK
jgi:cytochrome c oxidase assembly protein subunit 15